MEEIAGLQKGSAPSRCQCVCAASDPFTKTGDREKERKFNKSLSASSLSFLALPFDLFAERSCFLSMSSGSDGAAGERGGNLCPPNTGSRGMCAGFLCLDPENGAPLS